MKALHLSKTLHPDSNRRRGLACWVLVLWLVPLLSLALDVHSIQIGRYPTADSAESARAAAAETCSPAFIRKDTSLGDRPYALLVGHFPYYAEAWVCMKKLREQGTYPQAEVVTWEWDGRDLEQSKLPIDMPFDTKGLENAASYTPVDLWKVADLVPAEVPSSDLLSKQTDELSRDELLLVGLAAPKREQSLPALERFLPEFGNDTDINRVRLRLVRRMLGTKDYARAGTLLDVVQQTGTANEKYVGRLLRGYVQSASGDRATAMGTFRVVANDSSLPSCIRLDAMQRYARIAHDLRDYPAAWLAFEQIEQTAPDAPIVADARMQRAGFAFELVGREKGSWDEARRLCESVDVIPDAPAASRATAHLMYTETFFKEQNYDRAIQEADKLVADFPTIDRERVSALYWKARSLEQLRRSDESLAVYAAIDAEAITPDQLFPALNAKAKGLFHQARLLQRQGKDTEAQAAAQKLLTRYPNSREARAYQSGAESPDR